MTKPGFSGASAEASVPCKCLQYCANTLVFQGKPPTDGYYFGPAIFAGSQPFGGTALPGTSVQTGGEDYLRQFVWPHVVSSNPVASRLRAGNELSGPPISRYRCFSSGV